MKLIIFPLLFLVTFVILGQMLGQSSLEQTQYMGGLDGDISQGFKDADAHLIAYPNGTSAGENGTFTHPNTIGVQGIWNYYVYWKNSTGTYPVKGATGEAIMATERASVTFDFFNASGMLVLIGVALAGAAFVGFKVLGIGEGETSSGFIIKGGLLLTIWGLFSVGAWGLITQIPMFGYLIYAVLTIIYCIGIVNTIGSPGVE